MKKIKEKKVFFNLDDNFYIEKHQWNNYSLTSIVLTILGILAKFINNLIKRKIYKKKGFIASLVFLILIFLFLSSTYMNYNHYLKKMDKRIKIIRMHHSKNYERKLKILNFKTYLFNYLKAMMVKKKKKINKKSKKGREKKII